MNKEAIEVFNSLNIMCNSLRDISQSYESLINKIENHPSYHRYLIKNREQSNIDDTKVE